MRDDDVKNRVLFLQQEIGRLIASTDVMDNAEREKMIRNIEYLMDENKEEVLAVLDKGVYEAYKEAVDKAVMETQKRGIELTTSLNSQVHKEALYAVLADTMLDMAAAYRTAKQRLIGNINKTLDEVQDKIAKGIMYGQSRRKVIKAVYDNFLEQGLTSFVTIDGKELPLDFYAETVTRTKMSRASYEGHANHYRETDVDLVQVVGASDPCSECAPYHHITFSLSGDDKRFPHLPDETIPLHPNCRCSIIPFVESYEDEEDVQAAIDKSKMFNPNLDPRTEAQRKKYKDMQDKRRVAREELKRYNKIKEVLGSDAPKTLGAYRRMKRNNTKGYKKLQSKMRALNKTG